MLKDENGALHIMHISVELTNANITKSLLCLPEGTSLEYEWLHHGKPGHNFFTLGNKYRLQLEHNTPLF